MSPEAETIGQDDIQELPIYKKMAQVRHETFQFLTHLWGVGTMMFESDVPLEEEEENTNT